MALDEERTREDGDVKQVLVKFSDDPELEYQSCKISWGS